MREFDIGEFARIAHELGVTPDDLDTLVRRGPDAIEELPKLLSASTRRRSHARCRWFSETWSASVRLANTSASAITISRPAPPGSTTRNIAATQRPSTH